MNNKNLETCLNMENGQLRLTNLIAGTMVYLYDVMGGLKEQYVFIPPQLDIQLPEYGVYVLVMSFSNCTPEVRRISYLE